MKKVKIFISVILVSLTTNSPVLANKVDLYFDTPDLNSYEYSGYGTKDNPFTQEDLIKKFDKVSFGIKPSKKFNTMAYDFVPVIKKDILGVNSRSISFDRAPEWIIKLIRKETYEEKRLFWKKSYMIIIQDNGNELIAHTVSKDDFHQRYEIVLGLSSIEKNHKSLWFKIKDYPEISESDNPYREHFMIVRYKKDSKRCMILSSRIGMDKDVEYWYEIPYTYKKGGFKAKKKPRGEDSWFFLIGKNGGCPMESKDIKYIYQTPPIDKKTGLPVNWGSMHISVE